MTTINQTVQTMVDALHTRLVSPDPLSAEEQMLISKALDALLNNAKWEQALVAIAELHIDDAKAALVQVGENTNLATQDLIAKINELIWRYSHLREVGFTGGLISTSDEVKITPPAGCACQITTLHIVGSSNVINQYTNNTRCIIKEDETTFIDGYVIATGSVDFYNTSHFRVGELHINSGFHFPPTYNKILFRKDKPISITCPDLGSSYRVLYMVTFVTDGE